MQKGKMVVCGGLTNSCEKKRSERQRRKGKICPFECIYLHDPDHHNGVITHLEPDVLEGEVKWALESITTNKASGGDGIPVELFQILKDDAVKVLHSIQKLNFCSFFGFLCFAKRF